MSSEYTLSFQLHRPRSRTLSLIINKLPIFCEITQVCQVLTVLDHMPQNQMPQNASKCRGSRNLV